MAREFSEEASKKNLVFLFCDVLGHSFFFLKNMLTKFSNACDTFFFAVLATTVVANVV